MSRFSLVGNTTVLAWVLEAKVTSNNHLLAFVKERGLLLVLL